MGRRFSLEFGRKGPEGLNEEHDEKLLDDVTPEDERDGTDIKKILDGIDASMDEDYEDCKKKSDLSDELARLMNDDEEIDEYYDDCEKEEVVKKEIDNINKNIEDIFG